MHRVAISLQALVAASVFFVWVVRYPNIVQEFEQYGLPDWSRDVVGILKMTFSLMLVIGIERGATRGVPLHHRPSRMRRTSWWFHGRTSCSVSS